MLLFTQLVFDVCICGSDGARCVASGGGSGGGNGVASGGASVELRMGFTIKKST